MAGEPDLKVLAELETRLRERLYPSGRPRRLAPARRWLVPAAGLAAAAAGLIAIAGILGAGGGVETSAAAMAALDRAARAAARGPGPPSSVRPGEFWYTRTTSVNRLPVPIFTRPPGLPPSPPGGPVSPAGPHSIPSPPPGLPPSPPGGPVSPAGPHSIPSPSLIGPVTVTVVWRTATETWVGRDGTT
ncbi:MAG: hypothetical protein QOE27_2683, partial [Solirubrobacteraceae bacterium]|nr:hypothetical protein [Solirubrobacteraceae bacterium]